MEEENKMKTEKKSVRMRPYGINDPVLCRICDLKVSQFNNIKRHMIRRHPDFVEYCKVEFGHLVTGKNHRKDPLGVLVSMIKLQQDYPEIYEKYRRESWRNVSRATDKLEEVSNFPPENKVEIGTDNCQNQFTSNEFEDSKTEEMGGNEHNLMEIQQPGHYNSDEINKTQNELNSTEKSADKFLTQNIKRKISSEERLSCNECDPNENKSICNTCDYLKTTWNGASLTVEGVIEAMYKKCSCSIKFCCCKRLYKELKTRLTIDKIKPKKRPKEFPKHSNFFETIDSQSNQKLLFCKLCYKYSPKTYAKGEDFVIKGYSLNNGRAAIKTLMKKHLSTDEHKKSMKKCKERETNTVPQDEKKRKLNENFCMAVVFCAIHLNSYQYYSLIYEFIEEIGKNIEPFIHPLGAKTPSLHFTRRAQLACYNAVRGKRQKVLSVISPFTLKQPKVTITTDRMYMEDKLRQVILSNHINEDGLMVETIITGSTLTDSFPETAVDHLIRECNKMLPNLQNIAAISIGGYEYSDVGNEIIQKLKKVESLGKNIIFLTNYSSQLESLFSGDSPLWFLEFLANTKMICYSLNPDTTLCMHFNEFIKKEKLSFGMDIDSLQNTSENRSAEYMFCRIKCIIFNLANMIEFLPHVIESKDYEFSTKCDAMGVLKYISDPEYIASIFLMYKLYSILDHYERMSCKEDFGIIDYINTTTNLKKDLIDLKLDIISNKYQYIIEFLSTGILKSNIQSTSFSVNMTDITKIFNKTGMNVFPCKSNIINDFKEYVSSVLSKVNEYIIYPEVFFLTEQLFFADVDKSHRLSTFRKLFSMFNIEFHNCSPNCVGLTCVCLSNELSRFFDHYNSFPKIPNLLYYLNIENLHIVEEMKITNVCRIIEIILILKPNKHSIEDASLHLNKIKSDYFIKRHDKTQLASNDNDIVDLTFQIGYKTSILTFDFAQACDELEQEGIFIEPKNKDIEEGIVALKEILNDVSKQNSVENVKN